ncbi:MAG: hypothetical protein IPP23_12440 [Sphingomonadales bacterium]|nr:hypothetical protein [Sphingomonadales bacterium]
MGARRRKGLGGQPFPYANGYNLPGNSASTGDAPLEGEIVYFPTYDALGRRAWQMVAAKSFLSITR